MPAALLFVPLISPYPAPVLVPVRVQARGSLNSVNGHTYREPRNFI